MKFSHLLSLAVVLFAGAAFSSFAQEEGSGKKQWVLVKEPFKNIYTQSALNINKPKPDEIIRQTRKNERIELIAEGESGWYKVRVYKDSDDREGVVGILEAQYVKKVNSKDNVLMFVIYIILFIGLCGGTVYYIKKQQEALAK
jgi:hypothetical protein